MNSHLSFLEGKVYHVLERMFKGAHGAESTRSMGKQQTKQELHISVRNLVEFIFREGDIDNRRGRAQNADAMLEGSRIHRKIQGGMGDGYMAEVPLSVTLEGRYLLKVEGRADGIFTDEGGYCVIDEIKGVCRKLELFEEPVYVHKAQAMCYAYIFAKQNELPRIGVQMTYCNLDTEERKYFREDFLFPELETWFFALIAQYRKWADFQYDWRKKRQASIRALEFPFAYRRGQRELAKDVYRTIARKKTLFLQAPTGVGKTISTIFPAVKAVGEGLGENIFYLTAKTVTAAVAKETFQLLRAQGYQAKILQITAKEKLCFCEEMECNPVNCPYAKGHYDRVNDAVFDLLQNCDMITREEVLAQAEKFRVCPFEMSLDAASWSDDIICDYNYVFDPNVYLKRFFQEGIRGDYIFLVDEAHNLVERSRKMYSAALYKEDFLLVKKLIKPYSRKLERLLDQCNKTMLAYKRECENYRIYEEIGKFYFSLMRLASEIDEFLEKNIEFAGKKEFLEFYLNLRGFLNIYELTDENYVIYTEFQEDGRFCLKLFCVDPSRNLQKCIEKANATVFFSATLLPIQYYKRLLSTKTDNYAVYAESAFGHEQRLLAFGRDVSTKYTRRNRQEYEKIAAYISKTIHCRKGNYMAFFPSYKLMEEVYEIFCGAEQEKSCSIVQKSGMTEQEREDFLAEFEKEHDRTFAAFCVMGGIFSEGIDLKNDRLIGAVIVGTGLPQISSEREILKNYYDGRGENGFDYAFRFPGLNKVLQAAGRVIRTADDCGVILLLDERFLQRDYDRLYPREWEKRSVCTLDTVETLEREFWEKRK